MISCTINWIVCVIHTKAKTALWRWWLLFFSLLPFTVLRFLRQLLSWCLVGNVKSLFTSLYGIPTKLPLNDRAETKKKNKRNQLKGLFKVQIQSILCTIVLHYDTGDKPTTTRRLRGQISYSWVLVLGPHTGKNGRTGKESSIQEKLMTSETNE